MDADVATTPPLLRLPILVGLALLAAYFAACFTVALERTPWWAIPGGWQMFTMGSWGNTITEAEAQVDGEWVPVPLEELFVSQFDSGPRYRNIRHRGRDLDLFAAAICNREPRDPERVRVYLLKWTNKVGVSPHLHRNARREMIIDWDCTRVARKPAGIRL